MQIFEAFAGIPNSQPTSSLAINTGHGDDLSFHNRLPELFETNIPMKNVAGFQKQNSWSPEAIDNMFANRKKVLSVLRLKPSPITPDASRIVHVRGKDKLVASAAAVSEKVLEFANAGKRIHIMSDDKALSGAIAMSLEMYGLEYSVSESDDITDWYAILHAKEILGVLSTFTLSTLLIDPDKKISLFGKEYNDGPFHLSDENYEAAERIIHWCPNVQWI